MTTSQRPQVECERHHTGIYMTDIMTAVAFYRDKLGFTVGFTWGEPTSMAGMNLDKIQIFLEQGTPDPKGCNLYFVVGDADELYEFQRANGVEILQPPTDQHYGLRDFAVKDLHGYVLSFGHYIYSVGEPIRIERVDVPLRLEKRLAALLQDLAKHKRMSLTSTVEEILLHTNDRLGDGVPSPHTKRTLEYIQELKKKHGIDYDSHGSYRFVED
ncbi:MAG TPA: VOC family protein [Gemmatimonadaceae bacterium]|nr:VOC family protein [Gemmatimonadaceae bacterium]